MRPPTSTSLRERRHRLSQEVTRLSWLRRLVVARSDLEVARLTGVRAEVHEVPASVRAALEAVPDVLGPEPARRPRRLRPDPAVEGARGAGRARCRDPRAWWPGTPSTRRAACRCPRPDRDGCRRPGR
nr:hypothetical protein [Angustibacter aerolatus]